MNDAKIVLNTMTWFKAGAHDRIFNGMLAKAVVVTDDSTYLRREFTDGRELVMFRRQELEHCRRGCLICLDIWSGHRRLQIVDMLRRGDGHTWKSRAEYLKECFLT